MSEPSVSSDELPVPGGESREESSVASSKPPRKPPRTGAWGRCCVDISSGESAPEVVDSSGGDDSPAVVGSSASSEPEQSDNGPAQRGVSSSHLSPHGHSPPSSLGRLPLSWQLLGQTAGRHQLVPSYEAYAHRFDEWRCMCPRECSALVRLTDGVLKAGFEHFSALTQLPSQIADLCLRDLLDSCRRPGAGRRCTYAFSGQRLCKRTLLKLLGVGVHRVTRVQAGRPDGRGRLPCATEGHPQETAVAADVFSYLWGVYETEAQYSPMAASIPAVGKNDNAKQEILAAAERFLSTTGGGLSEMNAIRTAVNRHSTLLQKVLPPGNKMEIYRDYVSASGARGVGDVASYTTFKRVWRRYFKPLLKRDKFAKHAQCDVCSELKALIRNARDPTERCRYACLLVEHRDSQQQDRQIYYKVRELARQGLILTIMQDGSDQERYRVCRVCRMTKEVESSGPVPRLKLVGSLVHGVCGCFHVIEDDVPKNAQTTVELLMSSIEEARRILNSSQKPLPGEIWLQLDNTSAENKNQTVFAMVAGLVAKGVFQAGTVAFLRKGHTHEDLDGLWGVNATELDHVTSWNNPDDILGHTHRVMSHCMGDLPVITKRLDFFRRWDEWREGFGIQGFPGCTGKGSPHFYRFSLRRDLPQALLPRLAVKEGQPGDVLMEVKEFMADKELSQDVICVIPAGRADLVPVAPCLVLPRYPIPSKIQVKLEEFCKRLLRHFPEKHSAAQYIRRWASRTSTEDLKKPLQLHFLARTDARSSVPHCSRAAVPEGGPHCVWPVKTVGVTRAEDRAVRTRAKRPRTTMAPPPMPFAEFVAARTGQGSVGGNNPARLRIGLALPGPPGQAWPARLGIGPARLGISLAQPLGGMGRIPLSRGHLQALAPRMPAVSGTGWLSSRMPLRGQRSS